jgi:F-type H+-transporting ATPase subunit gamma
MPSLRESRQKIKSVGAQQRIFKAMKMIAAARMRRSQAAILSARPFAVKMEGLVRGLAQLEKASDLAAGREVQIHEYFDTRPADGPVCLVLVAADKGLCGAFNSTLLRAAVEWLRAHKGRKIYVAAVGRKSRDFLHRIRGFDFEVIHELTGVFPKITFAHAELLGRAITDAYSKKGLSQVTVMYQEFKSVAVQRLIQTTLLPIPESEKVETALPDYGFEPDRQELLSALLPRYLKAQLFRVLLESQAAELAARMNAMDAASKNAKELRNALVLGANRQRQAMITKELAELVGGAEALAS